MKSPLLIIFILLYTSVLFGQISIPNTSFTYTQNFDGLSNTGSGNLWTDNATISGWYATEADYDAGTGSSNSGALYSFGSSGNSERALGSVASGGTGTMYYGVRFINNTGAVIHQLTISYFGEQWRNGGNTTAQNLTFAYQIGATSLSSGTWTDVSQLTFTGPIATSSAGALDGNLVANRTQKMHDLVLNLSPGQEVWFRWEDLNDSGNDHGLSVDDLSVFAFILPVTFLDVSAKSLETYVDLHFSTAEEINNDFFSIEKSKDGVLFQEMAKIKGHGTSSHVLSYKYRDNKPFIGTNYYRIKQIDFDGKSSYSPIVTTQFSKSNADLKIFSTNSTIYIQSEEEFNEVQVFNINGSPVYLSNTNSNSVEVDGQNWAKGCYVVKVSTLGTSSTKLVWKY
ncbi:MAG: T9SS type A sorting domain-containing protein [Saprospiraceae bacterium]